MEPKSLLDALDIDARLSLPELVEALRERVLEGDAAHRELARLAFERVTEGPLAHFDELVRSVPRAHASAPKVRPRREPPAHGLSLDELWPRARFASLLPPAEADERALFLVVAAPLVEVTR